MTRKQMAFFFAANAVLSAVISAAMVLLLTRVPELVPNATTPTQAAIITQPITTESPTVEPIVHVVQPGDTLSGIALTYDVQEADIIAANQLENPDFLQVGMLLLIPKGGLLPVTATFTQAPTATDTPIPFEPPSADMTATAAAEAGATATPLPTPLPATGELQIEISEILAPGQVDQERVIISNKGERLADMLGWELSDADGNVYTFPNFRLWAGGSVTVHTRAGLDGNPPANFFWGKLQAVWAPGELVTLRDGDGSQVSSAVVGQ